MSTCEACHTIPPVTVDNYELKGTWTQLAGLDVYVTGSSTSKAIVDIYDAFGASPQILQGADLIATALDAIVLVPDFFRGAPAKSEWFVDPSEEAKNARETFMKNLNVQEHVSNLHAVVAAANSIYPTVQNWGAFGLCFGAKVAVLASGEGTPFKVTGQAHPAKLESIDAKNLAIPHIMLASKNEDPTVIKEYAEILAGEGKVGEVETYASMHHGWMGTRADLKNEDNLKEYERGYNQLARFFAKFL